jgi:hypothetical protein
MTLRNASVLCSLGLMGAAVLAPGQTNPTTQEENVLLMRMTDPQIMATLAYIGLEYETARVSSDNTTKFRIQMDGTVVNLYQYKDEDGIIDSLRLSAGYDLETGPSLEAINDFSKTNRFCTIYLDSEKDPFIVYDLDVRGGVTRDAMKGVFLRFNDAVKDFESELIGKTKTAS